MQNKLVNLKITYSFLVFATSVLFMNNIYASNIIYHTENKENSDVIRQELNDIINEVVKPKAEDVYIFNDEVKATKNPNFVDKTIIYQPSVAEYFENPIKNLNSSVETENNNYEIRYIRHTQSITKVYDYEFEYDGAVNKWVLHFVNDDKYSINPYSGTARNGFYKIGDNTYYFDEDGYMYVGILIDERDTVYNFNEEGILVFEGKLG